MDILYWGSRGSGKTFGAVFQLWLDWVSGKEIWSNTPLNPALPHKFIDTVDLIHEAFKAIEDNNNPKTILIDETHTQADSRTSGKATNRQLVNFVTQARKRNARMLYTTQILNGFDVRLRALTDRVIKCVPLIDPNDIGMGTNDYPEPLEFQYIVYVPQEDFRLENSYAIPRGLARLFYDLYETEQAIMPIEMVLQNRNDS